MILKQSTSIDIRMGPFVDATDGVTPETGITIGAADQAEVLKANGAATVAMTGTLAAVTGADGWYDYTVQTGDVDTVGEVVFVIQDASVCLPVFVRAYVVEEAVYDAMYGASSAGPLQSTTAGRKLDVTATGAAGIDWGNVENPTTAVDLSGTDIKLVDTCTTNTDMRGTDSAALASVCTEARLAELDAANLPADIAALNDISVADILTTAMTEAYAADGSAPTLAQALFAIQQFLQERAVSGTTMTVKKLDGTTTAMTFTLDDAAAPTSLTRAT